MIALRFVAIFAALTGTQALEPPTSFPTCVAPPWGQGMGDGMEVVRMDTLSVKATAVVAAASLTGEKLDKYLVGVPGGTAPLGIYIPGDVAYVTFNVIGDSSLSSSLSYSDADGNVNITVRCAGANKISSIICAGGGYVTGVFVNSRKQYDDITDDSSALDFSGTIGTNFSTLSPPLNAMFFVGDGMTGRGDGDAQRFDVPKNATGLFLGIMDCSSEGVPGGYEDNSGKFVVTYTMWRKNRLVATVATRARDVSDEGSDVKVPYSPATRAGGMVPHSRAMRAGVKVPYSTALRADVNKVPHSPAMRAGDVSAEGTVIRFPYSPVGRTALVCGLSMIITCIIIAFSTTADRGAQRILALNNGNTEVTIITHIVCSSLLEELLVLSHLTDLLTMGSILLATWRTGKRCAKNPRIERWRYSGDNHLARSVCSSLIGGVQLHGEPERDAQRILALNNGSSQVTVIQLVVYGRR
jgi:hypothetical protein